MSTQFFLNFTRANLCKFHEAILVSLSVRSIFAPFLVNKQSIPLRVFFARQRSNMFDEIVLDSNLLIVLESQTLLVF